MFKANQILICKESCWSGCGENGSLDLLCNRFIKGQPYRVFAVYGTHGGALEIQGEDGTAVPMKAADVLRHFIVPDEGMLYAVRRYCNELPEGEYGISDAYYLVGAFPDIETACKVWASLQNTKGENDEYDMFAFVPGRVYERGSEPYLGGGEHLE